MQNHFQQRDTLMRYVFVLILAIGIWSAHNAISQNLDGSPYDPATEPDIDMFIASWKESVPTHSHGTLVESAVFTKGDNPNPKRKGSVL